MRLLLCMQCGTEQRPRWVGTLVSILGCMAVLHSMQSLKSTASPNAGLNNPDCHNGQGQADHTLPIHWPGSGMHEQDYAENVLD